MVAHIDPVGFHEKEDNDVFEEEISLASTSHNMDQNKINTTLFDSGEHHSSNSSTPLLWMETTKAKKFFVCLLTCLYVVIVTIIGMVVEISPQWRTDIWVVETVFFHYMYGVGLLFFAYCYFFMIYVRPYNFIINLLAKYKVIKNKEDYHLEPLSHTGEGAGTLYLRLGALFFGICGIVLCGLEMFLCVSEVVCHKSVLAKDAVTLIFTFVQMHFLFSNSKITITRSRNISRWGFMHLVAVNIWAWFRYVLAKQVAKATKKKTVTEESIEESLEASSSSSSSEEDGDLADVVNQTVAAVVDEVLNMVIPEDNTTNIYSTERLFAISHFGGVATFLTTCMVEYSIIGAAVMFIIWGSINHPHGHGHGHSTHTKKKRTMKIDCSSYSIGFFFGVMMFIATLVCMAVYTVLDDRQNKSGAAIVFGVLNLVLLSTTLVGCVFALWKMRLLQYRLHAHGELIDEILLIIGFLGEMIYTLIGIDMFIATQRQENASVLPIFVFVVRFFQIIVQTIFIFVASRLRCLSDFAIKFKPGRQIITFLLVTNIAMFALYTFEATKTAYGINYYLSSMYMTIIYGIGPLLVFFRFHSSACFAEIWKVTYATNHGHGSVASTPCSSRNTSSATEPV